MEDAMNGADLGEAVDDPRGGLPSRLRLDRLEAGELGEGEAASLREGLAAHPQGPALMAERRAHGERLSALLSREAFVAAVAARVEAEALAGASADAAPEPSGGWLQRLFGAAAPRWALGLALAAALGAIVVLPRIIEPGKGYRLRGGGAQGGVEVLRQEGDAVARLSSGDRAREGDRIQLAVRTAGRRFALVVNLDDQGVFTPYFPDGDGESLPLEEAPTVLLPWAIELDGFVGRERIFILLSDEALSVAEVEDAALGWAGRQGGEGPLPLERLDLAAEVDPEGEIPGLVQIPFDLVKE